MSTHPPASDLPRDAHVVQALRRELNRNSRQISQSFWKEFEQIRSQQRTQLIQEHNDRQRLADLMRDVNQEAHEQVEALSRSISSHGINPSAPSPLMRKEQPAIMPPEVEEPLTGINEGGAANLNSSITTLKATSTGDSSTKDSATTKNSSIRDSSTKNSSLKVSIKGSTTLNSSINSTKNSTKIIRIKDSFIKESPIKGTPIRVTPIKKESPFAAPVPTLTSLLKKKPADLRLPPANKLLPATKLSLQHMNNPQLTPSSRASTLPAPEPPRRATMGLISNAIPSSLRTTFNSNTKNITNLSKHHLPINASKLL